MKKQSNTLFLAQSAMIAAIYVVLTVILAPFSYGEVQVRVSEALTILPNLLKGYYRCWEQYTYHFLR